MQTFPIPVKSVSYVSVCLTTVQ